MAITDEERYRLYQRLEAILGHDEAATLMEHLPPVGWADVATKRDVELMEARLESRLTRTFLVTILASNATLAGLAFGAARLA